MLDILPLESPFSKNRNMVKPLTENTNNVIINCPKISHQKHLELLTNFCLGNFRCDPWKYLWKEKQRAVMSSHFLHLALGFKRSWSLKIIVQARATGHGGVLDHVFRAKCLSALSLYCSVIVQTLLTGVYVFRDEAASWPRSTQLRSLFCLKSRFKEPSITNRAPLGLVKVWPVTEWKLIFGLFVAFSPISFFFF